MAVTITFAGQTLAEDNYSTATWLGPKDLDVRPRQRVRVHEGLRWKYCCLVEGGNWCTELSFTVCRQNATCADAYEWALCFPQLITATKGTLVFFGVSFPDAVLTSAPGSTTGCQSQHRLNFTLGEKTS